MDNRLQAGTVPRESILDLLASTHAALTQTQNDQITTEPSRLYVSQRDWWLRRVTDNSRDIFRQGQWHLAIAKRLADGVKAHCRQRRWQEPSWKSRSISTATRDFWQLQSSFIDWPPCVTGYSALLPEYRSWSRGAAATECGGLSNKRPRSPVQPATSPVETQRRSKRRRRVQTEDPPPSVTSAPPKSPSPTSPRIPPQVITPVDSESLLFGKRLQQTFWPATCSGDGQLRWPARELEDYSARMLQFMSKAARITTEDQDHASMPQKATSKVHHPGDVLWSSGRRRRNIYSYVDDDEVGADRAKLQDLTDDRHHNMTLRCRVKVSSGWDPQSSMSSLRRRDETNQHSFGGRDALLTSYASPSRKSRMLCRSALATTPSIHDQVRSGEAAYLDRTSYLIPPKLVDIFQLTSSATAGTKDQSGSASTHNTLLRAAPLDASGNLDSSYFSIQRPITSFARISRSSTSGDTYVEMYPCSASGGATLHLAVQESLSDLMTIGSLLLMNYWDVGMSLRALCRLQKLMNIAELQLSAETESEAIELAAAKGAADTSDICPIETPMHPTIHGFQEFSAHGLLKSSSPAEWVRRFSSKLKVFRPMNSDDPKGKWIDVHSPEPFSFQDPFALDLPLEALLFLSRRHARDRRKSLQQVRSGASKDEVNLPVAPPTSTSSFKLEQALLQSQTMKSDDLTYGPAGSISGTLDASSAAVKPSLFRRSVNTINRCPSWAIAIRLSAWSKLPENLWDGVVGLVASAPSVGGPLFDPQAKAAANAPILRVKKEDSTLSALLTLLNRSIRVPEPIILYSRMVRQVPPSASKTESDSLSAISNQFCLPVTLAVKGPSRTVRRLEFSWTPAEELVLWQSVLHQIAPLLTDEVFVRNELLNVNIFLEAWKQQCLRAYGKGPLKSITASILAHVNWDLVAIELNQALRPFDRARSSILCEAKFISFFTEIACASFQPYGDYRLGSAPASEGSGRALEGSGEAVEENSQEKPTVEDDSVMPAWEKTLLRWLRQIRSGAKVQEEYPEDLWTPCVGDGHLYEVIPESISVDLAIAKLRNLLDETAAADVEEGPPLTVVKAFPLESMTSSSLSFCQQECTIDTIKAKINRQVMYSSIDIEREGFDNLLSTIKEAWCVSCLQPLPPNYLTLLIESSTLRDALAEYENSYTPCELPLVEVQSLKHSKPEDEAAALTRARETLVRTADNHLSLQVELSQGGKALLYALNSTSSEVLFRKIWDYQEAGGLMSPVILRLLNDDKSQVLTREITEWSQLCLHGSYRLATTTSESVKDATCDDPRDLAVAALSHTRQQTLERLAQWMMSVTGADQLVRLSGHLSQFHTNSVKRRKLLLSQEGQIENYYLDHHLRAHIHTSPSCLSMLQAIRDIMTLESQQSEGRVDLGYREVTPATVFHHTCVNYNRIIFPCHASHEKLQSECEARLTSLQSILSSIANVDMLFKQTDASCSSPEPAESLVAHIADAPLAAAALLSRLPIATSFLHLSKMSTRDTLPELLFQCIYRGLKSPPNLTKTHFPKAPFPKVKLNLEEAHKAMLANTIADKSRREGKGRKPWADANESPSRASRPDGGGGSRNRSQPVQAYPQVHAYRPSSVSRPPVMDFKQIPPMQQIQQGWSHVYDPNMRPPHYAMLSPADPSGQPVGQHLQIQTPNLQSYPMPSIYQQSNDPWRRSASVKPTSYQPTPSSDQQQAFQHHSWYAQSHMNHERYPQPTYIEFRPQQSPQVAHYPTASSTASSTSRHYQQPTAEYSSYYQPYLQTGPAPGNTYIYGMYGMDRSAAATSARASSVGYASATSQHSHVHSLSSDGQHKSY